MGGDSNIFRQTCLEERHAVFRVRQKNRAILRLCVATAGAVTFVALVAVRWENFFIAVVRVVTSLAIFCLARHAFRYATSSRVPARISSVSVYGGFQKSLDWKE